MYLVDRGRIAGGLDAEGRPRDARLFTYVDPQLEDLVVSGQLRLPMRGMIGSSRAHPGYMPSSPMEVLLVQTVEHRELYESRWDLTNSEVEAWVGSTLWYVSKGLDGRQLGWPLSDWDMAEFYQWRANPTQRALHISVIAAVAGPGAPPVRVPIPVSKSDVAAAMAANAAIAQTWGARIVGGGAPLVTARAPPRQREDRAAPADQEIARPGTYLLTPPMSRVNTRVPLGLHGAQEALRLAKSVMRCFGAAPFGHGVSHLGDVETWRIVAREFDSEADRRRRVRLLLRYVFNRGEPIAAGTDLDKLCPSDPASAARDESLTAYQVGLLASWAGDFAGFAIREADRYSRAGVRSVLRALTPMMYGETKLATLISAMEEEAMSTDLRLGGFVSFNASWVRSRPVATIVPRGKNTVPQATVIDMTGWGVGGGNVMGGMPRTVGAGAGVLRVAGYGPRYRGIDAELPARIVIDMGAQYIPYVEALYTTETGRRAMARWSDFQALTYDDIVAAERQYRAPRNDPMPLGTRQLIGDILRVAAGSSPPAEPPAIAMRACFMNSVTGRMTADDARGDILVTATSTVFRSAQRMVFSGEGGRTFELWRNKVKYSDGSVVPAGLWIWTAFDQRAPENRRLADDEVQGNMRAAAPLSREARRQKKQRSKLTTEVRLIRYVHHLTSGNSIVDAFRDQGLASLDVLARPFLRGWKFVQFDYGLTGSRPIALVSRIVQAMLGPWNWDTFRDDAVSSVPTRDLLVVYVHAGLTQAGVGLNRLPFAHLLAVMFYGEREKEVRAVTLAKEGVDNPHAVPTAYHDTQYAESTSLLVNDAALLIWNALHTYTRLTDKDEVTAMLETGVNYRVCPEISAALMSRATPDNLDAAAARLSAYDPDWFPLTEINADQVTRKRAVMLERGVLTEAEQAAWASADLPIERVTVPLLNPYEDETLLPRSIAHPLVTPMTELIWERDLGSAFDSGWSSARVESMMRSALRRGGKGRKAYTEEELAAWERLGDISTKLAAFNAARDSGGPPPLDDDDDDGS